MTQLFTNSTEKTIASTPIYKQHDGVVVGTLLYPILGNIFLNSNYAIINKSDSSCVLPASLQPHYCRWVRDTFTSFKRVMTNPKNSCHILKSRSTPQCKINCRKSVPQNLVFHRLQCHYQARQSSIFIIKK